MRVTGISNSSPCLDTQNLSRPFSAPLSSLCVKKLPTKNNYKCIPESQRSYSCITGHASCKLRREERALAPHSFSLSTWGWTPWLDSDFCLLGNRTAVFRLSKCTCHGTHFVFEAHRLSAVLQLLVTPAALLPFNLLPLEASSPSCCPQQHVVCLWQNQERKGEIKRVATHKQVTIQSINQSISGNICIKSLLLYFATKATAFSPSCCVIFIAGKISAPKSTACTGAASPMGSH